MRVLALLLLAVLAAGCAIEPPPSQEGASPPPPDVPSRDACEPTGAFVERTRAATAVVSGQIHLLGGANGDARVLGDVVVVDPETGREFAVGELPSPRYASASATIGGTIYLFGGQDRPASYLDEIVAFDADTGRARIVGRLPEGRSASSAATDGERIYLVGGDSARANLADILRFDPATGEVVRLDATLPDGRNNPALAIVDGTLLIAGGNGDLGDNFADVYALDLATERLRRVGALPSPAAAQVALLDESAQSLYLIGGWADPDATAAIHRIELGTWETDSLGLRCAPARYYGGLARVGDDAYILGGQATQADIGGRPVLAIVKVDLGALRR